MSPAASCVSPAELPLVALHGHDHEVAALGDHARERGVADQLRARRDHDLREAGPSRQRRLAVDETVLLDERASVVGEVLRQRPRAPGRQQSCTEEEHDRDRAGDERDAGEREREVAEAAGPGVVRVLGGDHVHRRARQGEQRPGVCGERERHQELRGRPPQSCGRHDHHGQQRRHGSVHADQRREHRDEQHHQDEQPSTALADAFDQHLSGPRGDPGRVEALADDEERRDEQHRRVAEAGEGLVQVEDAGRPQAQRSADRDDGHRKPVEDEDHDDRREYEEGDGLVAHGGGPRPRGRLYVCTGEPGPSGIPIRYQTTKKSVHAIERITTYGSISETTVPMPASFL